MSAATLDEFTEPTWYFAQTFQLLRATIVLPNGWLIIMGEERLCGQTTQVERIFVT